MQPFEQFKDRDPSFWAFVKYVSETLGYTERGRGIVRQYPVDRIHALCKGHQINASSDSIIAAAEYSRMRADLLNNFAEQMLMK